MPIPGCSPPPHSHTRINPHATSVRKAQRNGGEMGGNSVIAGFGAFGFDMYFFCVLKRPLQLCHFVALQVCLPLGSACVYEGCVWTNVYQSHLLFCWLLGWLKRKLFTLGLIYSRSSFFILWLERSLPPPYILLSPPTLASLSSR